jgi:hypothetical protein
LVLDKVVVHIKSPPGVRCRHRLLRKGFPSPQGTQGH